MTDQLTGGAPHVYGGDPVGHHSEISLSVVLPMYMGVILQNQRAYEQKRSAPHVYGGDPLRIGLRGILAKCSPCIWG